MELKYQCPVCGTPLGYQGLCWKCRAAQDPAEVAACRMTKLSLYKHSLLTIFASLKIGVVKRMRHFGQIQWATLFDGIEGTLYIEFCPDCQLVSMQHQQT